MTHFAAFRIATFFLAESPSKALREKLGFREDARGANLWLVLPNDAGVFRAESAKPWPGNLQDGGRFAPAPASPLPTAGSTAWVSRSIISSKSNSSGYSERVECLLSWYDPVFSHRPSFSPFSKPDPIPWTTLPS
jgi:hypothetical protein